MTSTAPLTDHRLQPMSTTLQIRVNGNDHRLEVENDRLLLTFLRDDLGLTGTKEGCSTGSCGACGVLLDGKLVSSCLILAVSAGGREIETIEGVAGGEGVARDGAGVAEDGAGVLDPVQAAFVERGGLQCGFCTPGMIMAARALLDENPHPSEAQIKDWMMGNLCRCTGYYKILDSIRAAAARLQEEARS